MELSEARRRDWRAAEIRGKPRRGHRTPQRGPWPPDFYVNSPSVRVRFRVRLAQIRGGAMGSVFSADHVQRPGVAAFMSRRL